MVATAGDGAKAFREWLNSSFVKRGEPLHNGSLPRSIASSKKEYDAHTTLHVLHIMHWFVDRQ